MAQEKVEWKADSENIYERFMEQYDEAMSGERELTDGDQDMRYALWLQRERIAEKGAKLRYHITPRGMMAKGHDMRKWTDRHYVSECNYYTCDWAREIESKQGKSRNQKMKMTFYATKTDVIDGHDVSDETYVCPGCGAPSKISELLDGCKYCGSKFKMSELYPKISNHYMVEDISFGDGEFKPFLLKFMIPTGVIMFLGMIIGAIVRGECPPFRILSLFGYLLASAFFGVVLGYFLASICLIIYVVFRAGQTVPMMGSIGAGKRFEFFVKRLSPEFSYEYFTGKLISLLKMVLFAKDPQELPFYLGGSLDDRFNDLVDVMFRGAVSFKGMKQKDGYLHVTVGVFLDNAYVKDGKVVPNVHEKLIVKLVRNLSKPIQYNFSIQKMECDNCHGSFDARKNKVCPYCGTAYKIEDADWAIESIQVV